MALRRWAKSVLVAAVAGAMVLGSAGMASAAYTDCPSGRSCIWGDDQYKTANYDGGYISFFYWHDNFGLSVYGGTATSGNDTATSVVNRGNSSVVKYYKNANYDYFLFSLRPQSLVAGGERDSNLSQGIDTLNDPALSGAQANDTISSACFVGVVCGHN